MTLLPESATDRSYVLDIFVLRMQETNKKGGRVYGSYQILEMIEDIAIEHGLVECPRCGCKGETK